MSNDESRVLISKYLYAELTAEELDQLSGWIKASPANMDDFVREIVVHRSIRDQFLGSQILRSEHLVEQEDFFESGLPLLVEAPADRRQNDVVRPRLVERPVSPSAGWHPNQESSRSTKRSRVAGGLVFSLLMLCALFGFSVFLISPIANGDAVAEVIDHIEARLDAGHSLSPGDRLSRGVHRLQTGLLLVKFECEAVAVLEGPCVFNVLDGGRCEIQRGRACITCSTPRSRSFITQVRDASIADLGTEYGVFVLENGSWEAHVFAGEVAIRNNLDEQSTRLRTGQSTIGPAATPIPRNAVDERNFVRQIDFEIKRNEAGSGKQAALVQMETELRRDPDLMFWLGMAPSAERMAPTNLAPVRSGTGAVTILTQSLHAATDRKRGSVLEIIQPEHVVQLNVPGTHKALTLACWARFFDEPLTDREHRGLIMAADWNAPGRIHWQRKRDDIRLTFPIKGSSKHSVSKAATGRLTTNRWYHLVCVMDSGPERSIKHYLDGRLIESQPLPANAPAFSLRNCTLGGWLGSQPDPEDHRALNGAVDDVLIWEKALTENEVARLYQATLAQ